MQQAQVHGPLRGSARAVKAALKAGGRRLIRAVRGPFGGANGRLFDEAYYRKLVQRDPSEAVRSAEVLPLLHQYFEVLEVRGMGGTLLSFVQDFNWGLARHDDRFRRLANLLIEIEETLLSIGDIEENYVSIVAKNTRRA